MTTTNSAVEQVRRYAIFAQGRGSDAYAAHLFSVADAGEEVCQQHLDELRSIGKGIVDAALKAEATP